MPRLYFRSVGSLKSDMARVVANDRSYRRYVVVSGDKVQAARGKRQVNGRTCRLPLAPRRFSLDFLEHHAVVLEDLAFEHLQVRRDLVPAHPLAEVVAEELRQQRGVEHVLLRME